MVYQREIQGLTCKEVANNLNADPSTVSRVVARFGGTGDVEVKARKGAPRKMTSLDEFVIMEKILERPSTYLHELQSDLRLTTGTDIDVTTISRFLKRNNFSRKKAKPCSTAKKC